MAKAKRETTLYAVPGLEDYCHGCSINILGGYAEHPSDHDSRLHAAVARVVRRAIAAERKGTR